MQLYTIQIALQDIDLSSIADFLWISFPLSIFSLLCKDHYW